MKLHNKAGLISGGLVFIINMTENMLHYSIGKTNGNGDEKFKFHFPEKNDLIKMIGTSIIAGFVVGFITKKIID